ncbi:hypothetical protein FJTKL_01337 [Diaporthe vaccinii]|uniref:Uncharacterized protein n=1 Tax=Diaporthe vaccinii TaxID=105482 RepID=A0ABR4E197_9PEZI
MEVCLRPPRFPWGWHVASCVALLDQRLFYISNPHLIIVDVRTSSPHRSHPVLHKPFRRSRSRPLHSVSSHSPSLGRHVVCCSDMCRPP